MRLRQVTTGEFKPQVMVLWPREDDVSSHHTFRSHEGDVWLIYGCIDFRAESPPTNWCLVAAGVVVLVDGIQLVTDHPTWIPNARIVHFRRYVYIYIYNITALYITICVTGKLQPSGWRWPVFFLPANLTQAKRWWFRDIFTTICRAHNHLRRVDVWLLVPRVAPWGLLESFWAESGLQWSVAECRRLIETEYFQSLIQNLGAA